jgi:hypothetical protein
MTEDPDFARRVRKYWLGIRPEIRIVFPQTQRNMNSLFAEILDPRKVLSREKPFAFLDEKREFRGHELLFIRLVRQRLYEMQLMQTHQSGDIPIAVLEIVTKKSHESKPPTFPAWVKFEIPVFQMRFPADVPVILAHFSESVVTPSFMARAETIVKSYEAVIRKYSSPVFAKSTGPSTKQIAIKCYGDLQFQRGNFGEASDVYRKLFHSAMGSECRLMHIISEVCQKEPVTYVLLSNFPRIETSSRSEDLMILLTRFYLDPQIDVINSIEEASSEFPILLPFIHMQASYLMPQRRASWALHLVVKEFLSLNAIEYAVMALWASFQITGQGRFDKVREGLFREMVNLVREWNFESIWLGQLLPNLRRPTVLWPTAETPRERVEVCFCDVRVVRIIAEGFPRTRPEGIDGYWPRTAQQLFGAFDKNARHVFNDENEGMVGEDILIQVCIISHVMGHFSGLKLLCGSEKVEYCEAELENGLGSPILKMKPFEAEKVQVYGVEFIWNNVKCFRLFENPICFQICGEAPRVELDLAWKERVLTVGEILAFELIVKNGNIPLKYLAMKIESEMPCTVLGHEGEGVMGQQFLQALKPGEEVRRTIVMCPRLTGSDRIVFILPFWGFGPPCRYVWKAVDFFVEEGKDVEVVDNEKEIIVSSPPGWKARGFTSSLFNTSGLFTISQHCKCCVLSFIAFVKRKSTFEIPEFCLPFVKDTKELLFWAENGDGNSMRFWEMKPSQMFLTISVVKVESDIHRITLENVTSKTVNDVRIAVVEEGENITCLISGFGIRAFDSIAPYSTLSWQFRVMPLHEKAWQIVMVSGELFNMIQRIDFST